jgi:putative transposase
MSTYTQILYHIVFSTKDRTPCLAAERRPDLFRYVWGIIKNRDTHLYRINAMDDHVHILSGLHPSIALADFVKDIKLGASSWIKEESAFPNFTHWQEGYGAFTLAIKEKDAVIEYIRNQEEHHQKVSFQDELRKLLEEAGIEFDERYLV